MSKERTLKEALTLLKQVWICECDICGKNARATMKLERDNNSEPSMPDGWCYAYNPKIHICPECAKTLLESNRL